MSRSVRAPRYDVETIREQQATVQEALVIYPKHPAADAYRVRGAYEPCAVVATDKRFTDAELCAEFHAARADLLEASIHPSGTYWTPLDVDEDNTKETAMKRATTFLHFAARQHFDE